MGNHAIGREINSAFKALEAIKPMRYYTQDELLKVMDGVAEEYRGCDAEFDEAEHPSEPLGRALVIIYGDWDDLKDYTLPEHEDEWYDKIYTPFRKRYDFC